MNLFYEHTKAEDMPSLDTCMHERGIIEEMRPYLERLATSFIVAGIRAATPDYKFMSDCELTKSFEREIKEAIKAHRW